MAQSQRTKPEAASNPTPPPQKKKAAPRAADGYEETVTVACKMPNGMILQVCDLMDVPSPEPGRPHHTVKEWRPVGEKVTINGPAVQFGDIPEYRIVAGYALTEGVPAQFWDRWLEQHKDDASVKNKLIFAHERTVHVVDMAKDHKSVQSGLQPLKQENDPRVKQDPKFKVVKDDGSKD